MNIIKYLVKKVFFRFSKSENKILQSKLDGIEYIIEIEYGHLKSKEAQKSIDKDSNPIPWFTYPSIEYLKQLDLKNFNCLEWGCGNSTFFFAQKTKHITSIEDNIEWYQIVNNRINEYGISNIELLFAKNEKEYISPQIGNKYDIIIIDGNYRKECIETSINLFSGKGFIILDNSNRYPDFCEIIKANNLLQVDFIGFGPIVDFTTQTTFFFATESIYNIKIDVKIPIIGNPGNW